MWIWVSMTVLLIRRADRQRLMRSCNAELDLTRCPRNHYPTSLQIVARVIVSCSYSLIPRLSLTAVKLLEDVDENDLHYILLIESIAVRNRRLPNWRCNSSRNEKVFIPVFLQAPGIAALVRISLEYFLRSTIYHLSSTSCHYFMVLRRNCCRRSAYYQET